MFLDKSYVRYILLALFTFLSFPLAFYQAPQTGLDPSWKIALHLASQYDLVFGKDFVFTYGPLGILYSRLPIGVSHFTYLLFDFFFLFNFLFLLNGILKKRKSVALCLFIFGSILVTMYEAPEQWLFFFMLFNLFSFLQQPDKIIHLALAGLLAVFCFYVKVSLGIAAIVIFIVFVCYFFTQSNIKRMTVMKIFLAFISIILLSAQALNVSLTGYISSGLQLINAYNDAMGIHGDPVFVRYLIVALFLILGFAAWAGYRVVQIIVHQEILKHREELLMLGALSLYLFILFKSGFVRTDGTHVVYFFRGIIFTVSLLYLFALQNSKQKIVVLYSWLTLSASIWAVVTMPGVNNYLTTNLIRDKANQVINYIADFGDYRNFAEKTQATHQNSELKKIIGNKTVDVVPVEISQVYFNSLAYRPRPVIQSYSAYNSYLDVLNSHKYDQPTSPDFILFSLKSIDYRYPFFDETRTKLSILSGYQTEQVLEDQVVLAKREHPKKLTEGNEEIKTVKFGEDFIIPKTTSLQFTRVLIEYSFLGKLRRLFFKPPELTSTLTLENGDQYKFRVIPTILSGGVILNKFIDSNEEFELLMSTNGLLNANIDKVRFESALAEYGFKDEVKLITTPYWLNDSSKMTNADSLSFQSFQSRHQAILLQNVFLGDIPVRIWIDQLKTHSALIKISGWAFLENENNDSSKVSVILKSEKHSYELPTKNYLRPDLPEFYKRADVGNAAFVSAVLKTKLTKGKYTVSVRIVNKEKNIDTISTTDRSVIIE